MMTNRVRSAMLHSLPPVSANCRSRTLAGVSDGRLAILVVISLLAWGTASLGAGNPAPAGQAATATLTAGTWR